MKAFLFIVFVVSFQFVYAQNEVDVDLIRKSRQLSNEAIVKQDIDGISKFWLDDFLIIRGSGVVEQGKEANKISWVNLFKETPKTYFTRTPTEIIISESNPDIAWETGVWKGFNTYSKGGKYSAQWKRQNGEWKLQAELFVALEK